MFEQIRQWFARSQAGRGVPDHFPRPVTAGDQPLSGCRMIVLDLETSGLNASKDEVIAIGAVAIEQNAIRLDDQFDLVLRRPDLDITETVLIHGIGPEALTRGHETRDALIHLLEWMNGDPILAYHSAFDKKFLEKALKTRLGYSAQHLWIDVAKLLPAFFPHADIAGHSLDHWADHFNLQISERHHAAADALVTAELTLIALNIARKQNVRSLKELINKLHYQRRLQQMHQL